MNMLNALSLNDHKKRLFFSWVFNKGKMKVHAQLERRIALIVSKPDLTFKFKLLAQKGLRFYFLQQ